MHRSQWNWCLCGKCMDFYRAAVRLQKIRWNYVSNWNKSKCFAFNRIKCRRTDGHQHQRHRYRHRRHHYHRHSHRHHLHHGVKSLTHRQKQKRYRKRHGVNGLCIAHDQSIDNQLPDNHCNCLCLNTMAMHWKKIEETHNNNNHNLLIR